MTVAIQLTNAAANAMADALSTLIDAGSGHAHLKIYQGTLPSSLNPGADPLLADCTLEDPATAAAIAGVVTYDMTPVITATVGTSGTAGYFIVFDPSGTAVFGGNVATSAAALVVSTVTWLAGGTVSLNSGTHTVPKT